jgi:hypothetical protein
VLKRIFGPKREEYRSWRKVHNDEHYSLCSSPNIIWVIKSRRMMWVGHVACMEEGRYVYRVLVGRPKRERPLGRPKHKWEDNIKIDPREIGIDGVNGIWLAHDRVLWEGFCEHYEPLDSVKKAGYCLTSIVPISFSKNMLHHKCNLLPFYGSSRSEYKDTVRKRELFLHY